MAYQPRTPVTIEYLHAVGCASLNFTLLEWSIVNICEKISPQYVWTLKKKTAGVIASDFKNLLKSYVAPDAALKARLDSLAVTFIGLTKDKRNKLMHAKPATGTDGKPCLWYWSPDGESFEWSEGAVIAIAREFEETLIEANDLFHNHLK